MNRETSSSQVAVEADKRATEKKPYTSPSLKKRERLSEVAEGSVQFLDGRAGSRFFT
jgi:hypothetical protein